MLAATRFAPFRLQSPKPRGIMTVAFLLISTVWATAPDGTVSRRDATEYVPASEARSCGELIASRRRAAQHGVHIFAECEEIEGPTLDYPPLPVPRKKERNEP
jgi:hypothetical protein